jgi:hypothetical protein
MNCRVCGDEIDGRADKEFCSDKCRMILKRTDKANSEGAKANKTEVKANKFVRDSAGSVRDNFVDIVKDLGIRDWSPNGIILRDDITVDQVQSLAKLIHFKNGRDCPVFNEARL